MFTGKNLSPNLLAYINTNYKLLSNVIIQRKCADFTWNDFILEFFQNSKEQPTFLSLPKCRILDWRQNPNLNAETKRGQLVWLVNYVYTFMLLHLFINDNPAVIVLARSVFKLHVTLSDCLYFMPNSWSWLIHSGFLQFDFNDVATSILLFTFQ